MIDTVARIVVHGIFGVATFLLVLLFPGVRQFQPGFLLAAAAIALLVGVLGPLVFLSERDQGRGTLGENRRRNSEHSPARRRNGKN